MGHSNCEQRNLRQCVCKMQKRHPHLFRQQKQSIPRLCEYGIVQETLHSNFGFNSIHLRSDTIVLLTKTRVTSQARMVTVPSPYSSKPKWLEHCNFHSSDPFRVEWFCKTEMPFSVIHHLRNSLNENASVIVGKDGQEIEEGCGRELIKEMDKREAEKKEHTEHKYENEKGYSGWGWDDGRLTPPFFPPSGRGAYRGRGSCTLTFT